MKHTRTTPFRANEAAATGREEAIHEFTRGFKEARERERAAALMDKLIHKYGPVVEGYPSWHPFTSTSESADSRWKDPKTDPQGFEGLDHTIYLRSAFLTAPYGNAGGVVKSALNHPSGMFDAKEIHEAPLYHYNATPVLVICDGVPKENDGTISKRFALGNMLFQEVADWKRAKFGETWRDMRRYLLGTPCGSRSSLFVNQDTGKALREVYELLNRHELWGPARS